MSDSFNSSETRLPYPLGKITFPWLGGVALLALFVAIGLYAYSQQLRYGEIVTGMRTIGQGGVVWGLYICFVVYFIGISFAGMSVAALVRLSKVTALEPLTRIAELLTIVSLPMGALVVLMDLGRPLQGILYLPQFARPMSPFFGTFTLVVSGYLFSSLVYFYLAGRADAAYCKKAAPQKLRWLYSIWASGYCGTPIEQERHRRVSFWLAIFILPLLVVAHSTLGFVFGIQGGRPGWFSALQAPGFVVLAGCSGIGMLIIMTALIRRTLHLQNTITNEAFRILGNFLWILTLVYLYFMVVEELTANYASSEVETALAHEVVFGTYGVIFWITVASFLLTLVIGLVQYLLQRTSVGWLVTAGISVNIASILKRFLIVIPSQTHGMLLPYTEGSYIPSWVEISIVVGLFSLASLIAVVFIKVFPIVPVVRHEHTDKVPLRDPMRSLIFCLTLCVGLILMISGFLLSLRIGTLPHLDPLVPYSPTLFILGVMISFYSSAVYETIPKARELTKESS